MNRRPLRTVLLAAIGGVAIGGVLLTAVLTIGIVNLTAERTVLAELRRAAELAASRLERQGLRQAPPCRAMPALGLSEVCVVPRGVDAGFDLPSGAQGRAVVGGEDVLFVRREISTRAGPATMYLFRSASAVDAPSRIVTRRVLFAAVVALGAAAVVAYLLAGRIARPLGDLARAARGLARGTAAPARPAALEPAEVSELRDAIVELSADLAAARAHERNFLMSVSHELRTPLTAIRGYGEALADGTARGAQRAGQVIVNESRRLERLVQDLLDLERMQAGEFSVALEEADLARLARDVVEALRPRAGDAGVRLELSATDPARVTTDPDRAHQMLANLAENAMRVTPETGRVTVRVDGCAVEVSDTGPGIDRADIEHAFERFYLWRKYRGVRPVGTGLGLAIVGQLARLLDVKVEIASSTTAGTTFRLTFPPTVE